MRERERNKLLTILFKSCFVENNKHAAEKNKLFAYYYIIGILFAFDSSDKRVREREIEKRRQNKKKDKFQGNINIYKIL